MMIGVLKDIMDIDVYKNLKLQSARTDNYKAIMLTVPFSSNNVDTPTVSLETNSFSTYRRRIKDSNVVI